MWRGVALAALTALLAGCGQGAALDGLADAGAARVTEAITGDLAALQDGRTQALAGVIAPGTGEPHGQQAREALQDLTVGKTVHLLADGTADGGLHMRVGRRWVQSELIRAGAVRVRTEAGHRALAGEMLALEAQARKDRRGLWALQTYQVKLPREVVTARADGFQVVEGRVFRAAETAGRLYLEFSSEWRGGFSTETPLGDLPTFRSSGLNLSGLQGRLVRVRGDVRLTGYGPRLRLDHPEQIELLKDDRR